MFSVAAPAFKQQEKGYLCGIQGIRVNKFRLFVDSAHMGSWNALAYSYILSLPLLKCAYLLQFILRSKHLSPILHLNYALTTDSTASLAVLNSYPWHGIKLSAASPLMVEVMSCQNGGDKWDYDMIMLLSQVLQVLLHEFLDAAWSV